MFDAKLRKLIDPILSSCAARLVKQARYCKITTTNITLVGFGLGFLCCLAIVFHSYALALILLLLNRLMDGLDGTVARAQQNVQSQMPSRTVQSGTSDQGAFLDITLDFLFYAGFAFCFALADPERNALAFAFLLFSFLASGTSFLAFSIFAQKRGLTTQAQGKKSIYYLEGLAEGGETILCFIILCLFPFYAPHIAWAFGSLCLLSAFLRIYRAAKVLA